MRGKAVSRAKAKVRSMNDRGVAVNEEGEEAERGKTEIGNRGKRVAVVVIAKSKRNRSITTRGSPKVVDQEQGWLPPTFHWGKSTGRADGRSGESAIAGKRNKS